MPIPVDRSGNVDGEGGETDGPMRCGAVGNAGRHDHAIARHHLRKRLEQEGLQLGGTIRGARAARIIELAFEALDVQASALAPRSSMAELTNDADDNGTDDELGGA